MFVLVNNKMIIGSKISRTDILHFLLKRTRTFNNRVQDQGQPSTSFNHVSYVVLHRKNYSIISFKTLFFSGSIDILFRLQRIENGGLHQHYKCALLKCCSYHKSFDQRRHNIRRNVINQIVCKIRQSSKVLNALLLTNLLH